jgi:hypothetical protein
MTLYGTLPDDLGLIDISPDEMMCWLYLPISLANSRNFEVPPNLEPFWPLIDAVIDDVTFNGIIDKYIYITAKTLYVTPENSGNRPGWHSDGFMTDDINYIWSDSSPTVFWQTDDPIALQQDHIKSMEAMTDAADTTGSQVVFKDKHLLRLDQRHIHKVGERTTSGMRTFVKVSVSEHLYAHVGNSINHALDYPRPSVQRSIERNCPATTILTER